MSKPRHVSQPVERARIDALLDRSVGVPAASITVARVLPGRRQEKVRSFDLREDGRIVVDFNALRRQLAGQLVRFQLREAGQVLGTAQWHVPELPEEPEPAPPSSREPAPPSPELQRLREELAGVRGELRQLGEEARRLREALDRERAARHRAEAERDLARRSEAEARRTLDALQEKLHGLELERKESELAFRLLRERAPEALEAVSRLLLGR